MKHVSVKICGITTVEDAESVAHSGADFLGFIFAASRRRVDPGQARRIIRHLNGKRQSVGVFMDQPAGYVNRTASYCGLDYVQLHGKETPCYCSSMERPVIKRIDISSISENDITSMVEKYRESADIFPLFDPGAQKSRSFDWSLVSQQDYPYFLAGGLTPENVVTAVAVSGTGYIDVCSGVEKEPGLKDIDKVSRLIKEIR